MSKIILFIAALALTLQLHAQTLPAIQITEVNTGKKIAFDKTIEKGKVTLIAFWGTWCAHGKRQVKTISKAMPVWKKKVNFNFIAIATDQQDNEQLVRPYVQAHGWKFPCYVDANSTLKVPLKFDALPYLMIIDNNGKIAYTHTGYENEEILRKLQEIDK